MNAQRILSTLVIGGMFASYAGASEYQDRLNRAIEHCEAIDEDAYQSGLWLNPSGYQSYYERSACMQRAAESFRSAELCERVDRRPALFSSSWGYSESNCRELVARKIQKDSDELKKLRDAYLVGPVRLVDVVVERNGNGRDYDLVPTFSDGFPYGYRLSFRFTDVDILFYEQGSSLRGSSDNLRYYVRKSDIQSRFPAFEPGRDYGVEVTMTLSVGQGRVDGWLADEFITGGFPEQERSQTFVLQARF